MLQPSKAAKRGQTVAQHAVADHRGGWRLARHAGGASQVAINDGGRAPGEPKRAGSDDRNVSGYLAEIIRA